MKRILSIDGGGIRGVFSLEILLRMQNLLREQYANPALVLADHFDLFAGTSTGAIIATALCWGMAVEDILDLYVRFGTVMFTRVPWYRPVKKLLVSRYDARPLTEMLKNIFSECDAEECQKAGRCDRKQCKATRRAAMLDSPKLRRMLLVVVRNHTTGSAWPLTNNPEAIYNEASRADCNLKIPLWQIVRASTAAPIFFDPEEIDLGGRRHLFVDGGVTPYNNPALIAALTAVLPGYRMNWPTGPDAMRVISVGTMRAGAVLSPKQERLWVGYYAANVPNALIQGVSWQQDYICRCLGRCIHGETLDSEIGDLLERAHPKEPWFSYVRYNHTYKAKELEDLLKRNRQLLQLDATSAIPLLRELGTKYADENVRLEHLI